MDWRRSATSQGVAFGNVDTRLIKGPRTTFRTNVTNRLPTVQFVTARSMTLLEARVPGWRQIALAERQIDTKLIPVFGTTFWTPVVADFGLTDTVGTVGTVKGFARKTVIILLGISQLTDVQVLFGLGDTGIVPNSIAAKGIDIAHNGFALWIGATSIWAAFKTTLFRSVIIEKGRNKRGSSQSLLVIVVLFVLPVILYLLDTCLSSNFHARATPFSNDGIGITAATSNGADLLLTASLVAPSKGRFFCTSVALDGRKAHRRMLPGQFDASTAIRGITTKLVRIAYGIQTYRIGASGQAASFKAIVGRIGTNKRQGESKIEL
jgi:hypothetical protein